MDRREHAIIPGELHCLNVILRYSRAGCSTVRLKLSSVSLPYFREILHCFRLSLRYSRVRNQGSRERLLCSRVSFQCSNWACDLPGLDRNASGWASKNTNALKVSQESASNESTLPQSKPTLLQFLAFIAPRWASTALWWVCNEPWELPLHQIEPTLLQYGALDCFRMSLCCLRVSQQCKRWVSVAPGWVLLRVGIRSKGAPGKFTLLQDEPTKHWVDRTLLQVEPPLLRGEPTLLENEPASLQS